MIEYFVRRLLLVLPVLLGVTSLTFVLFHLFGGDPVVEILGKSATAAEIARVRHEHGLDRPLLVQYLAWLRDLARLELGRSFVSGEPVSRMLLRALGPSIALVLPAVAMTLVVSLTLATIAAIGRGRIVDRLLMGVAIVVMSTSFLVYVILGQYLFAFVWRLFPVHGYGVGGGLLDAWSHLALPSFILTIVSVGYDTRFYRSVLVKVLDQEYVVTARAKGLSWLRLLARHVLPNAMIPIVTRVSVSIPLLVTGSLLLESFFGIPGLGRLLYEAIDHADIPVLEAYTALVSCVVVFSSTSTDLLYALFDPRVRLEA